MPLREADRKAERGVHRQRRNLLSLVRALLRLLKDGTGEFIALKYGRDRFQGLQRTTRAVLCRGDRHNPDARWPSFLKLPPQRALSEATAPRGILIPQMLRAGGVQVCIPWWRLLAAGGIPMM